MVVQSATDARAQIIEEQFWSVVANIPGAVYRCACVDEWPIRFISDYIELLCGYPAADFVDNAVRTYGSIIHPDDRPYVAEEIDRALQVGAPYAIQYRVLHADGGLRWISERGSAILKESGERLWLDGVLLDVTDQVLAEQDRDRAEAALRQQAELNRHQALHDSLTDLPNRVLFQDRVRQVILGAEREGGGVAVLVMDLDRFKEINDTLGHASGDRLLVEAARRLRRRCEAPIRSRAWAATSSRSCSTTARPGASPPQRSASMGRSRPRSRSMGCHCRSRPASAPPPTPSTPTTSRA